MRPLLILILLLALVAPAFAQGTPTIVSGYPDGQYILTITNGAAKITTAPHLTPSVPVVPPPVIPPPPVNPDLSPKGKEIAAAAVATSDPTTAGNLAEVMKMIKSQVDGGTLQTYQQIASATMWLMDSIIGDQAAKWKATKDVVSGHLAALAQEGAQPEGYSGYFADAADGFESAVPQQSDAFDRPQRINIETLMKLFEFFVKYILPFIMK